ncbi:MAG: phosphoribosyltransferase [Candidatus Thermoplasmatota archaeon]|nr:phosphoribosyltransferase [Candidatus Thermoplasmatota archaeon]
MDFKARFVSWAEIDNWCRKITTKLHGNFKPDVIIGLSRGGLVPSRILSDAMFVKDLYAVKTEHWGITATRNGEATIQKTSDLNVAGKRVLIVDDITDTGGSMKLAYDFIKTLNPSELRTSTMLHINHSTFVPDFFAEEVSQETWTWFIFPWNVHEDAFNLSAKFLDHPMTSEEISTELNSRYGLNVDLVDMPAIFEELSRSGRYTSVNGKWALSPQ